MNTREKRARELYDELRRRAQIAQGTGQRFDAHFSLHRAACFNQDEREMVQRRDELHTLLDVLLDNGEAIHRLTQEAREIQRKLTND